MTALVAYRQYYYKVKYHGRFSAGVIAAVSDADVERAAREELGHKFRFSTALLVLDSDGKQVLARGKADELAPSKTATVSLRTPYPRYTLEKM